MNNPWTKERNYQRLCEEFKKHKTLFIAFDFDNTVLDYQTKEPYKDTIDLLVLLGNLHMKLILYTCGDHIPEKLAFCAEHKIPVTYINSNPEVDFGPGKVYFNALLDDRAGYEEVFDNLTRFINENF